MSLRTNPSALKNLTLALASGRPQAGSNGDGNAVVTSGDTGGGGTVPQTGAELQPTTGFANGTRMSGYSTPDQGPFRCDHCKFFDPQDSGCRGADVMKDPEVQKLPDGRGMVLPTSCCSKDYTPSNISTPGFTAISRPGTLGGMGSGSQPAGAGSNGPLQASSRGLSSPGSVG